MYSVRHRRPFSGSPWPKLTFVVLGLSALLLVAAPPALAECPPADPLCVAEDPVELETPPVPSLPQVAEGAGKAIDGAVNTAKGAVDKVVGQVTDTVDELLQPGGDDPGGGGEGGDEDGSANEPRARPGDGGRSGSPDGNLGGLPSPGSLTTPANVPSTPTVSTTQPGLFGRIGDAAVEAARRLGFPLALAVIVVAFVMIQNYLDRKDPKLALAPIRPEVLRFE